jgi:hypothetical protein
MYYSSTEIHKILYSKLLFNNNLNDPINKLPNIIIKYKKYFINEYRLKYNIYTELYSEIKKSTISKYKFIITSTNFIEVINDFIAINNNL